MKTEWLTSRCDSLDPIDIAMAEAAATDLSEENKRRLVTNSPRRKKWNAEEWQPFIADLQPDDEVWRFRSPATTWANSCGRAGYSVVRDGQILRSLVTVVN